MIYFDSAYLAKCYLREPGFREVRALAERAGYLVSSAISRVEVTAVFHRHFREGRMLHPEMEEVHLQFAQDCTSGVVMFLPVAPGVLEAAQSAYRTLPAAVFLRSADCIHLAAAGEAGFAEIYSNDRHLLAAASHFGLRGIDVIAAG